VYRRQQEGTIVDIVGTVHPHAGGVRIAEDSVVYLGYSGGGDHQSVVGGFGAPVRAHLYSERTRFRPVVRGCGQRVDGVDHVGSHHRHLGTATE
jgi:hypothetical protein